MRLMSESRRGGRSGRPERGGPSRGGSGQNSSGRGGSDRGRSSGGPRGDKRDGGKPDRGGRPERGRGGRPDRASGGRGPRRDDRRQERPERTEDQKIYDGPPIPDDVSAKDLDKYAWQQLQSLPEKLRERVARHLVMAGILVGEDPETAHKHALAARARASRNGLIREASGETAYAAGKFAEALSEFRAAKRMNGQQLYAPMMADCERALGRPEKALAYDTADVRKHLDEAGQVELTIVVAGARRDLDQAEAAVRLLETENLHSASRSSWVPRLRYAYADALLAVGRTEEAIQWFHRTVAVDAEHQTDAEDRLAELE